MTAPPTPYMPGAPAPRPPRKPTSPVALLAIGVAIGLAAGSVLGIAAVSADDATAQTTPATMAPTPALPAPAAPSVTPQRFGPGTYMVDADNKEDDHEIEPGIYRATVPADSAQCYWARLTDTSGSLDSILASEIVSEGQAVVTIFLADVAFKSSGCGTWEKVMS